MINKTCPLNSKYKLYVVLNAECDVAVRNAMRICSGCSFFQFSKPTEPKMEKHTWIGLMKATCGKI